METSIKGAARGKSHSGLTKSLEAFYQRVIKVSPQSTLPSELFTYGVPYEASRTYRTMKSEFECRRCGAMIESARSRLRSL